MSGEGPPPPDDAVRVRMVLAYDGSGFHGFARQPGQRTVAGELARRSRSSAATRPACLRGPHRRRSPRTRPSRPHRPGPVCRSRGPEALGQPPAGACCRGAFSRPAPEGFDARHSALSRSYRYLVFQAAEPDPLLSGVAWHVSENLDLRMMRAAADGLIGEHDFSAFCRRPPGHPEGEPMTRRVIDAGWGTASYLNGEPEVSERLLRFDITASSFCHQMIRSVVGVWSRSDEDG